VLFAQPILISCANINLITFRIQITEILETDIFCRQLLTAVVHTNVNEVYCEASVGLLEGRDRYDTLRES
jgi:hypothetical protein